MSEEKGGYIAPIEKSAMQGNCHKTDPIAFSDIGENRNSEAEILSDNTEPNSKKSFHVWVGKSYTRDRFWKSKWIIVVIIILILLLLLFIGLWISQLIAARYAPCLDSTCIKVSSDILSNLDTSISPCDNFYEYACNGWIKQNHIPQGHNTWSIMRKLSKNGEYFTKELLENESHTDSSRGLRLAQIYYNSCMNEALIESRGFEPLYNQITALFGGWLLLPTGSPGSRPAGDVQLTKGVFSLTDLYLPSFKYFGNTPLFRFTVGQDQMNSSRFVIDLSEGLLCLQREYYVNETYRAYTKKSQAFREFMYNYSAMLGVPEQSLKELDKVYRFEKEIALRTEERSEKDPEKNYELINLDTLIEMCPVLDWMKILQSVYRPLNYTITPKQAIALHDRDFFKDRCKLYMEYLKTEEGIRILHNTAVWTFLWKTVSRMPKRVNQAMEAYKEAESGLKMDPARWQSCVTEVQGPFGIVMGRFFVKEKFDQKSKDAATEMITAIKAAFKANLDEVPWMQETDKVKAREKVDSMKASVGYPQNIDDLEEENKVFEFITTMNESTYFENALICAEAILLDAFRELIVEDPDKWVLPVHIVNAYYKENSNHIYFPAGILQSPIYHHHHPLSLNFGGIGMVVGHEITHAFDQHGAKFDSKGNLREWWSNETRSAFEKNSHCMIEQYNNYSILNTSLNGKMTLGENIADNGGIKAAFKAFKVLESKYTDKPYLPGLPFTSDQLFFIGFAQLWCVKNLPQSVLNAVLFDVHTVEQYRVIGTLSNSEDFARVFNCPVGSPMNPAKKCQVW